MTFYRKKTHSEDGDKFSNFGKRWSHDEENKLLSMIKEEKPIFKIAKELGRTNGSVQGKFLYIAAKLYYSGKTEEEISEMTKLDIEEIKEAVALNKNKIKVKESTPADHITLLKQIKDLTEKLYFKYDQFNDLLKNFTLEEKRKTEIKITVMIVK